MKNNIAISHNLYYLNKSVYKSLNAVSLDFKSYNLVILSKKEARKYKQKNRETLVIFDNFNNYEELIDSKASLWIDSKTFMAYTLDGSEIPTKDAGARLIKQLNNQKWFKTSLSNKKQKMKLSKKERELVSLYPKEKKGNYLFGTVAIRKKTGFLTTLRGKNQENKFSLGWVNNIHWNKREVKANQKVSLNAPLLGKILEKNPQINYIIHGHDFLKGDKHHLEYEFPGTEGDLNNAIKTNKNFFFINLPFHGYLAGFSKIEEALNFCLWENYRNSFPRRYIDTGFFDKYLSKNLKRKKLLVLDVGGGELGTKALDKKEFKVYGLDPYVYTTPTFYLKKITWKSTQKFDFIVLRGSINYLNTKELIKLKGMLKNGGRLIANTFKNPPSRKKSARPFVSLVGDEGSEEVILLNNKIKHRLKTNSQVIEHDFYYRSIKYWEKMFPGFKKVFYGNNSLVIDYLK